MAELWQKVRWAGREDELATIVDLNERPQPGETPDEHFVKIRFDVDEKELIVNVVDLTFV